ncbi:MAG: DUF1697 domain-containing protein [Nocardioides sp.]
MATHPRTHIAFLRAINLGARRKFPKAAIVTATEAAGFEEVATHINTGNVRFDTTLRSRARIESALETAYRADRDFEVPTVVFTQAELRAIADEAEQVAAGHGGGAHYVSLLKEAPTAALAEKIEALGDERGRAHVSGRAVHLLVMDPYHQARLTNVTVEKLLGVATNRNLSVISALAQKWC